MDRSADRLARMDWVLAGLRALASGGVEAVKVDRLARELRVSRGSFYWHFKDRADLLGALLDVWQSELTESLIEEAAALPTARERLLALAREAAEVDFLGVDNSRVEIAFRQWASEDAAAAARMMAIDERRTTHLEAELAQLPVVQERRPLIARAMYLALLGLYLARGNKDLADERAYMMTIELLLDSKAQ